MPNDAQNERFAAVMREELEARQRAQRAFLNIGGVPEPRPAPVPVHDIGEVREEEFFDDDFIDPPEPEEEVPAFIREMDVQLRPKKPVEIKPNPFLLIPEKITRLPRFLMPYDGVEEWKLRVEGTIITIYDRACHITRVGVVTDDNTSQRGLGFEYHDGEQMHRSILNKHGMNLRSVEPGYLDLGAKCLYLIRRPVRVYKQGINHQNAYLLTPGTQREYGLRDIDTVRLVRGLNAREKPVEFIPHGIVEGHISSQRLSNELCAYRKNANFKHRVGIEYRNRYLGHYDCDRQVVVIGPNDAKCPWIVQALAKVNLAFEEKGK